MKDKTLVVPQLVDALALHPSDYVREQAMCALGTIARSPATRDHALKLGALQPLLQELQGNVTVSMLRSATWALSNLCRGKPQFALVKQALGTLAQLIWSQDDEVLKHACLALSYLAHGPNEKIQAVIESGAVERLVELLMHPQPSVQTPALRALGNLATGDDLQNQQVLQHLVAGVNAYDPTAQLQAITQFRKLLSIERNPPTQQVVDQGVVPRFVEFLQQDQQPVLQFEAAWALTNIVSGTSEHTRVVIDANAVPALVALLLSPSDDVCEQAAWALGNIAGDSPTCRDLVLRAGALPPLLQLLLQGNKLSMLRNATWALSNFCRGKPQPQFALVRPALGTLAQLIHSQDDEVLADVCWALSHLSDGPNEKIQAVIESGVVRRLVELLMHPQPSVQTPALRTVGNIVTGDDLQTQLMLNGDALPCLRALLHSQKEDILKEACWTLSNITAGNKQQIQAVIDADVLPPLIQLLANAELAVRKEAAWVICNATSGGTPQQIKYLVQVGCIRPLCDLLVVADKKIIAVALEGLENILKVGDEEMRQGLTEENDMARFVDEAEGLSKMEFLQQHEHAAWPRTSCESWAWTSDIYDKAVKIIETYFSQEEDDKDDDMPPLDDEEANVCVERDHHSALDRIHVTGHHGGIELDDTDDTVDDLAEQFDMMKELQDALGRSCDVGDDADEAHLESELDLVHSAVHLPPAALLPLGARVSDAAGDPGTIIDTNCSYTVRYDSGKTCYNVSKGLTLSTGDPDDFDFANHAEDTDDEEYMSNLWPGSPEYTSAPSKSALNVFSCEYDCGFISDFDTVSAHECACPMHPGTAGSTA
jgi:HEAT repeat protein